MRLEDLRVEVPQPIGDEVLQRLVPVSPADILALLREWGGEEVWKCKHPGFPSSMAPPFDVLPVHPCSPKENPNDDPMHVEYHAQHGCGWYLVVPLDVLAADTEKEQ